MYLNSFSTLYVSPSFSDFRILYALKVFLTSGSGWASSMGKNSRSEGLREAEQEFLFPWLPSRRDRHPLWLAPTMALLLSLSSSGQGCWRVVLLQQTCCVFVTARPSCLSLGPGCRQLSGVPGPWMLCPPFSSAYNFLNIHIFSQYY